MALPKAAGLSHSGSTTVSFRDPGGALLSRNDRILRIIGAQGIDDWTAFKQSAVARAFEEQRKIVATTTLDEQGCQDALTDDVVSSAFQQLSGRCIVEHEKVPFVSYPYEWAPEMLHSAAELTLDLAIRCLDEDIGIKDGTPYNVLFRGSQPVFVDVLSFERRDSHNPIWLAYAQFVRTFILPLLASKHLRVALDQSLLARRDGIEPEELYRWLGPLNCLKPSLFGMVFMPSLLARSKRSENESIYRPQLLRNEAKARFVLQTTYKQLRRALTSARPESGSSSWSDYMQSNNYSHEHFGAKEIFVQAVLAEFNPRRVLDVGCNTGHFSFMSAKQGASVVAIDYDYVVVGQVWKTAHEQQLDILPLVVNLARPTPGTGWCNRECASFLERAHNASDLVLMLAVIHHMLVTERIPLREIMRVASDLTNNLLIIEFVGPEDSMFRRLLRGREALHNDLCSKVFEDVALEHFEIVRRQHLEGTHRWLYLLRKRQ